MATNNAINLKSSGIVTYDAAGAFTASTVTNHGVVTAGANNTVTSVAPGTSGNVLTSNGTDWTSAAAPSGSFVVFTKTLTNSQIKNLHATPIELVAAQGANKVIVLVSACAKLVYGGTNVFTAAASQKVDLYWNNSTTNLTNALSTSLVTNTMLVSSASKFSYQANAAVGQLNNQAVGVMDNVNLAAWNNSTTEIGGNAANDNTIIITIGYYIATMT